MECPLAYARDRTVFAGGPQGLGYKSTDNGNSWTQIDYEFDDETIAAIATGPDFANDQTVFIGTLGDRTAAVHLSRDGGETFERFVEHDSAAPWIALGIPASYTPEDPLVDVRHGGAGVQAGGAHFGYLERHLPREPAISRAGGRAGAGAGRRAGIRRHQRRGLPQRDERRVVAADQRPA